MITQKDYKDAVERLEEVEGLLNQFTFEEAKTYFKKQIIFYSSKGRKQGFDMDYNGITVSVYCEYGLPVIPDNSYIEIYNDEKRQCEGIAKKRLLKDYK